jgi:hypothetical protein
VRSEQRQEKVPESVENDPAHRAQLESYIRQLHYFNRCRCLNRLSHRNAQDLVGEIDAGSPGYF